MLKHTYFSQKALVFFIVTVSLMQAPLFAQESTRLGGISIKMGDKESELGTLGAEADDWRPLFFTVEKTGTIVIPDYYKGRLARYDSSGRFLNAYPCSAVSPRMNVFKAAPSGFVAFNDGRLIRLNEKAEVQWEAPFPLMVFPDSVIASDDGVSCSLSGAFDSKQGAVFIPEAPPHTASLIAIGSEANRVPAFKANGTLYAFSLGDAKKTNPSSWTEGQDNAAIAAFEATGITWWTTRSDAFVSYWRFDEKGKLLKEGSLLLSDTEANGFCIVVIPDGSGGAKLYANGYGDKDIKIGFYSISK